MTPVTSSWIRPCLDHGNRKPKGAMFKCGGVQTLFPDISIIELAYPETRDDGGAGEGGGGGGCVTLTRRGLGRGSNSSGEPRVRLDPLKVY